MKHSLAAVLLWPAVAHLALGAPNSPALSNGVIEYTEEAGETKSIDVGKPCSDLWVSPDESVIAFIAIDEGPVEHVGPFTTVGPNILSSSIYIAWKADHYRPVPVKLGPVVVMGYEEHVLRYPTLSPDLKVLYFEVPAFGTSDMLMGVVLPAGDPQPIDPTALAYCPMWGGPYSGDLLIERRQMPNSTAEVLAGRGVQLPCYLRDATGADRKVAEESECLDFATFARTWSAQNGGSCSLGVEYVEAHGAPARTYTKP